MYASTTAYLKSSIKSLQTTANNHWNREFHVNKAHGITSTRGENCANKKLTVLTTRCPCMQVLIILFYNISLLMTPLLLIM